VSKAFWQFRRKQCTQGVRHRAIEKQGGVYLVYAVVPWLATPPKVVRKPRFTHTSLKWGWRKFREKRRNSDYCITQNGQRNNPHPPHRAMLKMSSNQVAEEQAQQYLYGKVWSITKNPIHRRHPIGLAQQCKNRASGYDYIRCGPTDTPGAHELVKHKPCERTSLRFVLGQGSSLNVQTASLWPCAMFLSISRAICDSQASVRHPRRYHIGQNSRIHSLNRRGTTTNNLSGAG
jgi:hypothetical protein